MKTLLTFIYLFFLTFLTFAKSPDGFSYQAIIRDALGNLKKNQSVSIDFEILDASNVAVYSESHTATTNDYGLVNLVIGQGTPSDDFSAIDWGNGTYSVNVNIDGTDMGTSFGEAIKNNDSQLSNFGIKLNLNLPLSNNTARGQYIQSKTLKNKAQINYEHQRNTIRLEVITAKNNLIAAKKSLDQVEKSVDRYNTVLDNEKLKFKEGITTLMELLLLQDRLILAELNLAAVRNKYIKAIIRFRYQIGILIPEQELSRQMLNEHFISIPAFNQDLN